MLFFIRRPPTSLCTLSLHDALPIFDLAAGMRAQRRVSDHAVSRPRSGLRSQRLWRESEQKQLIQADRKSTRLNSSHSQISYAVFCLKKKMDERSFDVRSRQQ